LRILNWHYYTFGSSGSIYETLARECVLRFAKFNIKVEAIIYPGEKIKPGGSPHQWTREWMRNILLRVQRLDEMAKKLPLEDGIGLLDSDLFPLQQPDLIVPEGFEIALTLRLDDAQMWRKACAGVVLFAPQGRNILSKWADLCFRDTEWSERCREQIYLWKAIQGRKYFNLGERYNSGKWIKDIANKECYPIKGIMNKVPIEGDKIKWLHDDDAIIFHDVTQKERQV